MREWITLVEGAEAQTLEEKGMMKKVGLAAAAAGLAAQAGMNFSDNAAKADERTSFSINFDQDTSITPDMYASPEQHTAAMSDKAEAKSAKKEVEPDPRGPAPQMSKEEGIRLLALTMWGEARSDGPEAMKAVGHVIVNRIHSERKFGRNIKEVVWKRKAFSCWNPSDPNRQAMQNISRLPDGHLGKVRWEQALKIARKIVNGESSDPTNGALFYHTKDIDPYWVDDAAKPAAHISSHVFYKSDRKA